MSQDIRAELSAKLEEVVALVANKKTKELKKFVKQEDVKIPKEQWDNYVWSVVLNLWIEVLASSSKKEREQIIKKFEKFKKVSKNFIVDLDLGKIDNRTLTKDIDLYVLHNLAYAAYEFANYLDNLDAKHANTVIMLCDKAATVCEVVELKHLLSILFHLQVGILHKSNKKIDINKRLNVNKQGSKNKEKYN